MRKATPLLFLASAACAVFGYALAEKSGYARCMSPGLVYSALADAML